MSSVHPVDVDGAAFAGMPDRRIRLDEMRDRLLDPRCSTATRDAVWAHLVERSRTEGAVFTAACVGLALPTLSRLARHLSTRFVDDPSDIHAAVLTGFVTTLAVVDLHAPDILLRLRWAAYRAGHAAVREALNAPVPTEDSFGAAEARSPSGHPDVVLARAVADGVITAVEAEIISATRLGDLSLAQAAQDREVAYKTLHQARRRAEARLAVYLTDEPLSHRPSPHRHNTADPTRTSLSVGNLSGRSRPASQAGVSKTRPLSGVPPYEKPSPADPASTDVDSCSLERF